jgi:curved DNA-binding protein CbpA
MTPKSELELQGNFRTHPFAELVAEIAQARLDGSLPISHKEKKCVVYFRDGRIVFAVSNARASRLFDILLRRGRLEKSDLAEADNYVNDFELAAFLQRKGLFTKEECDTLFAEQIEAIVVDILAWPAGEWTFSTLARARDGLNFKVDMTRLLLDYARWTDAETMLGRFRSLDESFRRSELAAADVSLRPEEAFVLSRAVDAPLTALGLIAATGMPEQSALHSIYTLWLGGLLVREDWQSAFSEMTVATIRGANLERIQEAKAVTTPKVEETLAETTPAEAAAPEPEVEITVEEYLQRVESANTYYEKLGIDVHADVAAVKRAYFTLARRFHPDKYHSDGAAMRRRVQTAFTEMAQAHEALKNTESRELYDFKMRKELSEQEKRDAAGVDTSVHEEQGAENFERGFSLLMNKDADAALPFFARAVHYAPKNARYHAYYGKALSLDESKRHKAESEMQAALKLDPNNPAYRIILAEFFIQFNLVKRAEGELNRLLALFPDNKEARDLLAKLKAA